MKKYRSLCLASGLALLSLTASKQVLANPNFETQVTLSASKILAENVLQGPNHTVLESVINDGYLNRYTIDTAYGQIQVSSTDKLKKYIDEINAIPRMNDVRQSDEFTKGITEKGKGVVEGAKNLATDPINTVGDAASGVGKLFSRGKEHLFGSDRSDAEGSRLASLSGYNMTKRQYAYAFGVDAYSHNTLMQERLGDLASAGYAGSMSMTALLAAVPGGAGTAVSITGTTDTMQKLFLNNGPADLRKMNRAKLVAMDVDADVIDIFIANGVYTPREQTLLVFALESMKGTTNRAEFIKFATLTDNVDVAFFRQRQAQMYAEYHNKIEPIERFITIGTSSAGVTKNGKVVLNAPLDHLLWTEGIASLVYGFEDTISAMQGVSAREVYLTGSVSALAKQSLENLGWKVYSQTR